MDEDSPACVIAFGDVCFTAPSIHVLLLGGGKGGQKIKSTEVQLTADTAMAPNEIILQSVRAHFLLDDDIDLQDAKLHTSTATDGREPRRGAPPVHVHVHVHGVAV